MNVYQKINAIMKDIRYIQKDAQVSNYKAVTHDQLVSVARQSIVAQGLVLTVSQIEGSVIGESPTKSGGVMRLYAGKYKVSLVNAEKPEESVSVDVEAHAMDNGDKAPGKCCTYATKTALLKLLWLETGESDESRAELKETLHDDIQKELSSMIDGDGALWQQLCKAYGITHLEQLRAKQIDEVKARINKYRERKNGSN